MKRSPGRIHYLWTQFSNDLIRPDELDELLAYLKAHPHDEYSISFIAEQIAHHQPSELGDQAFRMQKLKEILETAATDSSSTRSPVTENGLSAAPAAVRRMRFFRPAWVRYAAAIVLLLGAAIYYWNKNTGKGTLPEAAVAPVEIPGEIRPGGERAMLTLADGSVIVLDSATNGLLARQDDAQVMKLADGQLVYRSTGSGKEIMLNTMSTPRGGQYRLALPDGSKVWLNAASSITFPAVFVGRERKVKITGEAYFEVAAQHRGANREKMPFIVEFDSPSGDVGRVEVLGTHFNVMAYQEEAAVQTTLLEGEVSVSSAGARALLKPGQQASVDREKAGIAVGATDVEVAVAWKNGRFQFNGDNIQTIMREIGRWYDITIEYAGKKPEGHYSGIVGRDNDLSKVLKILEESGLHFKVEGKKLIVL